MSLVPACLAVLCLAAVNGCGGGSSPSIQHPPPVVAPPGGSISEISGTVTSVNNGPILGATVRFGSQSAASTQYGAYIIPNVMIPAGQSSIVNIVTATATIKGQAWSGQNQVELINGNPITSNVQVVLSPTNSQGSIIGVVLDSAGNRVSGARVFASIGPTFPAGHPDQLFFTNLASFNTTTRSDGSFTIPSLPSANSYTVTASLAGRINATTVGTVNVLASSSTQLTLTLSNPSGSSSVATPNGLTAQTITAPLSPTRSPGDASGFLNVIRRIVQSKRGLLTHHAAPSQKVLLHRSLTRSTPAGSLIETDLFWDYVQIDNLYGYDIVRATTISPANFTSIATVRDPQADRFADNDPILTPDHLYYYSIARLDTINFPTGVGGESSPVQPPVSVDPLGPLTLIAPSSGTVTAATPVFSWNAVNRANLYKVLVYDQFPTLQDSSDPNGIAPVWSADFSGTNATYGGTALISGHTYYWAVLGQDDVASAFTISALQTFVAP